MVNILAYADDLVVMAPSWAALQELLKTLELNITDINVQCNIDKTVCMVFNPTCRSSIVGTYFPNLLFNNHPAVCISV